ncbi:MAG: thermonuclease family protein [Lentisphaeria bacterium]|nr:thermonuclease family protein [Lentisphaeria bacterium]
MMKYIPLIIVILMSMTSMAQYVMKPTEHWLELRAHVTHFKDAKTFRIADERGIVHQLTLGAVEPPERGQPYFREALARVTELMKGKTIVVKHRYFDQKGQLLGQIYVEGQWVNKILVEEGLAWYGDPDGDAPELKAVAAQARKEKKGLWKNERAVPPWLHRQGKISYRPGMENTEPPKMRRYRSTNEPAGISH